LYEARGTREAKVGKNKTANCNYREGLYVGKRPGGKLDATFGISTTDCIKLLFGVLKGIQF